LKALLKSIVRHIFVLKLLESVSKDKTASLRVKKKKSRMHSQLSPRGSMHLIESSKFFMRLWKAMMSLSGTSRKR